MASKKNKTLFSNSKHVDISSILTSNVITNTNNNFIMQSGGAKTKSKNITKKKNINTIEEKDTDALSIDSDDFEGGASDDEPEDVEEDDAPEDVEDEVEEDEVEAEEAEVAEEKNESDDGLDEEIEETEESEIEDDDADDKDNDNDDKNDDKDNDNDDDKKCYSKYATDKNDDDIDLEEIFKDDVITINKVGRIGKPFLFKYEKVRLLSDRSRQLAQGAKPMIKNTTGLSDKEISQKLVKSQSQISNCNILLELPEELQKAVSNNIISAALVIQIVRETKDKQKAYEILKSNISENKITEISEKKPKKITKKIIEKSQGKFNSLKIVKSFSIKHKGLILKPDMKETFNLIQEILKGKLNEEKLISIFYE